VVSFKPCPLYPLSKKPRYPLDRSLVGTRAGIYVNVDRMNWDFMMMIVIVIVIVIIIIIIMSMG
jgi:hypothetical protein